MVTIEKQFTDRFLEANTIIEKSLEWHRKLTHSINKQLYLGRSYSMNRFGIK